MYFKAFLLLIFPLFALAQIPPDSKPRHDLYKKIKQTTNVSLKEAYQAVFNGNHKARYNLSQYARIKGTKNILKGLQLEIEGHSEKCKNEKEKLSCKKQISDLKKQKEFIRDLDKKVNKNPKLGLYKSLVVMSYVVRHEILKPSYEKWTKTCSGKDKINSLQCKKRFFETDILYSITRDLAQASYSKATNKPLSINKSKLSDLVARYE